MENILDYEEFIQPSIISQQISDVINIPDDQNAVYTELTPVQNRNIKEESDCDTDVTEKCEEEKLTTPVKNEIIESEELMIKDESDDSLSSDVENPVSLKSNRHLQLLESLTNNANKCGNTKNNKKSQVICLYCNQNVCHFPRHLRRKHSRESAVKKILSLKPKSMERNKLLKILRNKGNFAKKIQENSLSSHKNLVLPCFNCQGFYSSKQMSKHCRKTCIGLEGLKNQEIVMQVKADDDIKKQLFARMKTDLLTFEITRDLLICTFGVEFFKKASSTKFCLFYTTKRMRELAKLLVELRKLEPHVTDLQSALQPRFFRSIVRASKILNQWSSSLRSSLKFCCEITRKTDPTKTSMESLLKFHWNIGSINDRLPLKNLAEDIRLMRDTIDKTATKAIADLEGNPMNQRAFVTLQETVFIRVFLSNPVSCEVLEALPIHQNSLSGAVSTIQNILAKEVSYVQVRNRDMAFESIFFCETAQKHLSLLEKYRSNFVPVDNKFLFAKPETLLHGLFRKVLKNNHRSSGGEYLNLILAKEFKYARAILFEMQTMNENEMKDVATFFHCTSKPYEIVRKIINYEKKNGRRKTGKKSYIVKSTKVNYFRQRWTAEQKKVAINFFKEHIKYKRAPKTGECAQLIKDYPHLFCNKSWLKIKVFIQNIYTGKMRIDNITDLNTSKVSKVSLTSLATDLQLLKQHLFKKSCEAILALNTDSCDYQAYTSLIKSLYCTIFISHPVNVEKMLVSAYRNPIEVTEQKLTITEKILKRKDKRVIVEGETIAICSQLERHIDILLKHRSKFVDKNDDLLFSGGNSQLPLGVTLFAQFATEANLEHAGDILSKKYRKYVAVLIEVLNLSTDELDTLTQYIIFTGNVNKNESVSQLDHIIRITKLMILIEKNPFVAYQQISRPKIPDSFDSDTDLSSEPDLESNPGTNFDRDLDSDRDLGSSHNGLRENKSIGDRVIWPGSAPETEVCRDLPSCNSREGSGSLVLSDKSSSHLSQVMSNVCNRTTQSQETGNQIDNIWRSQKSSNAFKSNLRDDDISSLGKQSITQKELNSEIPPLVKITKTPSDPQKQLNSEISPLVKITKNPSISQKELNSEIPPLVKIAKKPSDPQKQLNSEISPSVKIRKEPQQLNSEMTHLVKIKKKPSGAQKQFISEITPLVNITKKPNVAQKQLNSEISPLVQITTNPSIAQKKSNIAIAPLDKNGKKPKNRECILNKLNNKILCSRSTAKNEESPNEHDISLNSKDTNVGDENDKRIPDLNRESKTEVLSRCDPGCQYDSDESIGSNSGYDVDVCKRSSAISVSKSFKDHKARHNRENDTELPLLESDLSYSDSSDSSNDSLKSDSSSGLKNKVKSIENVASPDHQTNKELHNHPANNLENDLVFNTRSFGNFFKTVSDSSFDSITLELNNLLSDIDLLSCDYTNYDNQSFAFQSEVDGASSTSYISYTRNAQKPDSIDNTLNESHRSRLPDTMALTKSRRSQSPDAIISRINEECRRLKAPNVTETNRNFIKTLNKSSVKKSRIDAPPKPALINAEYKKGKLSLDSLQTSAETSPGESRTTHDRCLQITGNNSVKSVVTGNCSVEGAATGNYSIKGAVTGNFSIKGAVTGNYSANDGATSNDSMEGSTEGDSVKLSATKRDSMKGAATKNDSMEKAKGGDSVKCAARKHDSAKGAATKYNSAKDAATENDSMRGAAEVDSVKRAATKHDSMKGAATKNGSMEGVTGGDSVKPTATKRDSVKGAATKNDSMENARGGDSVKGAATKHYSAKGAATTHNSAKDAATENDSMRGAAEGDSVKRAATKHDSAKGATTKHNSAKGAATKNDSVKGAITGYFLSAATEKGSLAGRVKGDITDSEKRTATKHNSAKGAATKHNSARSAATNNDSVKGAITGYFLSAATEKGSIARRVKGDITDSEKGAVVESDFVKGTLIKNDSVAGAETENDSTKGAITATDSAKVAITGRTLGNVVLIRNDLLMGVIRETMVVRPGAEKRIVQSFDSDISHAKAIKNANGDEIQDSKPDGQKCGDPSEKHDSEKLGVPKERNFESSRSYGDDLNDLNKQTSDKSRKLNCKQNRSLLRVHLIRFKDLNLLRDKLNSRIPKQDLKMVDLNERTTGTTILESTAQCAGVNTENVCDAIKRAENGALNDITIENKPKSNLDIFGNKSDFNKNYIRCRQNQQNMLMTPSRRIYEKAQSHQTSNGNPKPSPKSDREESDDENKTCCGAESHRCDSDCHRCNSDGHRCNSTSHRCDSSFHQYNPDSLRCDSSFQRYDPGSHRLDLDFRRCDSSFQRYDPDFCRHDFDLHQSDSQRYGYDSQRSDSDSYRCDSNLSVSESEITPNRTKVKIHTKQECDRSNAIDYKTRKRKLSDREISPSGSQDESFRAKYPLESPCDNSISDNSFSWGVNSKTSEATTVRNNNNLNNLKVEASDSDHKDNKYFNSFNNTDDDDSDCSYTNKTKANKKKFRQKRILVPWNDKEKKHAKEFFKQHIIDRKPPSRTECEILRSLYPKVYKDRSWLKIKIFIVNFYTKLTKDEERANDPIAFKSRVLTPWSYEEKLTAKNYFKEHVLRKMAPTQKECEEMCKKYPDLFRDKSWLKIKVFIQNLYTNKIKI